MRHFLVGLLMAAIAALSVPSARAADETQVDLELVLAVDISFSMDIDEQRLQRQGYVDALISPEVTGAIAEGAIGTIALSYVEWAGVAEFTVVVPWTRISSREDAIAFATRLAEAPLRRVYRTSITTALRRGAEHFDNNAFRGMRRVIDVSGDGPNNAGGDVREARDETIAKGITINGLPLQLKRASSRFDIEKLDEYYADCVIGGIGAFMEPVRSLDQFPQAIRRKIVREIAAVEDEMPIIRIDAREPADCLIGEKLWRERNGYGLDGPSNR